MRFITLAAIAALSLTVAACNKPAGEKAADDAGTAKSEAAAASSAATTASTDAAAAAAAPTAARGLRLLPPRPLTLPSPLANSAAKAGAAAKDAGKDAFPRKSRSKLANGASVLARGAPTPTLQAAARYLEFPLDKRAHPVRAWRPSRDPRRRGTPTFELSLA